MEIKNAGTAVVNKQFNSQTANVDRMIARINRNPLMKRRHAQLSIDDSIGRIVIKIIDTETDTVIKEVPPATLQKMYRNIRQYLDNLKLPSSSDNINV